MFPATADNDTVNPSFEALLAFVSRPSVHTHSAYPTGIMFHLFADGSGPNLIVGTGNFTAVATDVATDVTSTPDGASVPPTAHNTWPGSPQGSNTVRVPEPDPPVDFEPFVYRCAWTAAVSPSPSTPPVAVAVPPVRP